MRTISVSLLATLLAAAPLVAQVRADPGVVIGNRIAVRVNVTLADEETPYSPVRGLALAFSRPQTDTVVGRTDEAGVVTVLLTPGDYVVSVPQPYQWKGTWYTWTLPVAVRADMRAVDLNRANARVDRGGSRTVRIEPPPRQVQSAGDVRAPSTPVSASSASASTRRTERTSIRWFSMEVGGEGGVFQLHDDSRSDPGYGGSGAFVGGLGPVAVALGYRYTSIQYGGDIDNGSLKGGTIELRYHLRPGAAPVRPYVGALGGLATWHDTESLVADDRSTMRMLGGSVGVQIGLATSVRLHGSVIAAATNVHTSGRTSNNGLFATGNLGLTFDIFSPAR